MTDTQREEIAGQLEQEAFNEFCRKYCSPGADSSAWYRQIFGYAWSAAMRAAQEAPAPSETAAAKELRGDLRWALAALDLARNGLKNRHGLVETDDPNTCAEELWNIRAAVTSIKKAATLLESRQEDAERYRARVAELELEVSQLQRDCDFLSIEKGQLKESLASANTR